MTTVQINSKVLDLYHEQRYAQSRLSALMEEGSTLAKARGLSLRGAKHDPSSQTPMAGGYVHGAGGVLSDPGQFPLMFSAEMAADLGMASFMPVLPDPVVSDDYGGNDVPYIATFSGQTAGDDDWTDQPDADCDDPPIAGLLKLCTQTASYGKFAKKTRVIDRRRVGRLNNLGETANFQLANHPSPDDPLVPGMNRFGTGTWVNRELSVQLHLMGVGFRRMLAPLVYTGNPTNNSANGGRRQFPGFDLIYNTGKVDVFTQVACPAVDSLVGTFGNNNVNEADANGYYVYDWIESFLNYFDDLATYTGLSPVQWVLSMRKDLFWQIAELYPIQQHVRMIAHINTLNGANADGAIVNFSGDQLAALRLDMRNNHYLPVNGVRVPVILDDGIAVTTSGAEYISSIYFHPMTVMGGAIPVTYWQFFNYDNSQGREIDALSGGSMFTTDAGRFLWEFAHKNGCFELKYWVEPRIMSHVPFLGGRLDNIAYQPVIHARDPYPSDANYYDGGRTTGTPLTGYPMWSTGTQVNLGVL